MRVIFAGTPEFAAAGLRRLREAGFDIPLVLTQPDRPSGRGMKLHESPVKQWAQAHGAPLAQPRSLRLDGRFPDDAAAARHAVEAARADVMVVAAYGLILPQWVLDAMRRALPGALPGLGCINIHASLLPRWRGAAPIQRAIEAGDLRTGVCIMQMDAGLDTGDILLAGETAIVHDAPNADTAGTLQDRLATQGGDLVVEALTLAQRDQLRPRKQPLDGVTYAHKVQRLDARIDWMTSAVQVERRVRAFDPAPGAWTGIGGALVKVWHAHVAAVPDDPSVPPGSVVSASLAGVDVACGDGVLRMTELQRSGGKRLAAGEFLRGMPLRPGMLFGAA